MRRNDAVKAEKTSEHLAALAYRVRRLRPDHRDPHHFHEEKSEIAFELARRVA